MYMAELADSQAVADSYLVTHCCSHLMRNFGYSVLKYQKALIRIRMQMEGSKVKERI